ncbi:DUF362 domain-containing protein [Desulfothermus okinawensis JCM 13304]
MSSPCVSIVKYKQQPYDSLKEAIDLINGLDGFKSQDKILIKPNLVAWDFDLPFPPFGVVTTAVLMEALIRILHDAGYTNITIGESPLNVHKKDMGLAIYKQMGFDKLKERYGVELVDFNLDEFEDVNFGDFSLSIAKKAYYADKIINFPVLKTHNQSVVSLGLKNLKGCLNRKSKMFCHHKDWDLNHMFPHIIDKLPIALTIIDGIFALEKGPAQTGKAYRKDLIIASKDPFACDAVGAKILGYDVDDVEHLKYYAKKYNVDYKIQDIDIRGEKLEDHIETIEYDWEWTEDNTMPKGFKDRGISEIAIRKYDNTLCTGCSMMYNPMLILVMSAFTGKPFNNIEIVSGKKQIASRGYDYTVLFGNCACKLNKDNPDIKNPILVKGCPPKFETIIDGLKRAGLECDFNTYVAYRNYIFSRYKKEDGFDMDLYCVK